MNEVKKLDDACLAVLDSSCNNVVYSNWDGHVSIEQDSAGTLDFKLYSDEDELEAHFTATWAATIEAREGSVNIYAFFDEEKDDPKPTYLSLVPVAIMGLLGL